MVDVRSYGSPVVRAKGKGGDKETRTLLLAQNGLKVTSELMFQDLESSDDYFLLIVSSPSTSGKYLKYSIPLIELCSRFSSLPSSITTSYLLWQQIYCQCHRQFE